eukprot:scaffold3317_cov80-Phaeocystis_antarctica.AAC.9
MTRSQRGPLRMEPRCAMPAYDGVRPNRFGYFGEIERTKDYIADTSVALDVILPLPDVVHRRHVERLQQSEHAFVGVVDVGGAA